MKGKHENFSLFTLTHDCKKGFTHCLQQSPRPLVIKTFY